MDQLIKATKGDQRFNGSEFKNEFRGMTRERNFHDRRVVVEFAEAATPPATGVSPEGQRRRPRQMRDSPNRSRIVAELTGGIDVLMDPREETTIFVFRQNDQV